MKIINLKFLIIAAIIVICTNCTRAAPQTNNRCKSGRAQSPLDLVIVPTKPKDGSAQVSAVKVFYDKVTGTLKWDKNLSAFSIKIPSDKLSNYKTENWPLDQFHKVNPNNKKIYFLYEIVFRMTSEHKLNKKDAPMEIQMFHRLDRADPRYTINRLAISFFVEPTDDEPNPLLANILPEAEFDLNGFISILNDVPYLSYFGSLTSSPCTEDVNWFILDKKLTIGSGIYNAMKDITKKNTGKETNNRPVQKVNRRKIFQFGEIKFR